ncbi:alpha/beta fold hydrolase [Solibacillus daqui]|uniref:alpha/beta fold hydrolase n=1 Tax=Solibacillus daqui TaxID=2912187 RepID=UPI0023654398|nr:alpha/beta fold hydrolase [Solibacillus daqui]
MRKIAFSLATVLLLTACNSENASKLPIEGQTKQEVVNMNEALIGKWQGMIDIPQSPLEIILNLEKNSGNISVPAQGLSEFPFELIVYNDSDVEIKINLAGSIINITGTLKDDQLEGMFTQNGQSFPITLKPYTEAAVTYEKLDIPVADGELKAALQMPERPTGELVIIHAGSGPTNKDGNTIGGGANNGLKMIAESLAEQGIASIRFDKRGIGENTALITREENLTFNMYVQDVIAIIDYAEKDKRFNEIHLLGHSEGALIMTIAAQQNEVDSLISIAGAGRPVDEILMEQLTEMLPPDLLQESEKALRKLKAGEKVENVPAELQSLFRPSVQPYMISWLKYDPQQEIKNVKAPILILQGKKDIQVTEADAKNLQAANGKAVIHYFDKMNHVLKDIEGNREQNIASYSDPKLPLATGLIDEIASFIK